MKTKQSSRRTSKLALGINTGLCWCVAFYSLYTGQGAAVVGSCLALIGGLYGSYVGVGHLDYRRFLSCLTRGDDNHQFETDYGCGAGGDHSPVMDEDCPNERGASPLTG